MRHNLIDFNVLGGVLTTHVGPGRSELTLRTCRAAVVNADDVVPTLPRHCVATMDWDIEDAADPRAAAEAMWRAVRESTGPVVELVLGGAYRLRVDLEREPGEIGEVEVVVDELALVSAVLSDQLGRAVAGQVLAAYQEVTRSTTEHNTTAAITTTASGVPRPTLASDVLRSDLRRVRGIVHGFFGRCRGAR